MKQRFRFRLLLAVPLLVFVLVGCSSTTQATVEPSGNKQPLVSQVEQFESVRQVVADYLNSEKVVSITPEELYKVIKEKNPDYYLVDIRANQDFVASNLPGSVSIPYALTSSLEKLEALPQDKILVVIDYNGHLAAQTAATWNQLGYQAVPLLYGIQSWSAEESARGYEAFPIKPLNNPLVTEGATKVLADNSLPELMYPEGKTREYIVDSTKSYLDRNYKGTIEAEELASELEQGSDKHFLVDIRDPQHYRQGHIEGSVNIPLAQLASTDMVKKFPMNQRIVLIGNDGMDASQGTRSLVTLGYDCVALKYGMSYWSVDELVTGVAPVRNLVKEYYELVPLNYLQPSTGAAGCG